MSKKKSVNYLLEATSLSRMKEAKVRYREILDYHWQLYSELAQQRRNNEEELHSILFEKSIEDFNFQHWNRALLYQYSNQPLSSAGSLKDIGGRFNIGDISSNLVPSFSALYIASNKETAEKELLEQKTPSDKLTNYERALSRNSSFASVQVDGKVDLIFDLRNAKTLLKLNNVFKKFKLSPSLKKTAKELGQKKQKIITLAKELKESFLAENWRVNPSRYDIPANSQIFAQMVKSAGVGGIVYPSKMTGKDCLAIFPENLKNTASFIEIVDTPPPGVRLTRIDSTNFSKCEEIF